MGLSLRDEQGTGGGGDRAIVASYEPINLSCEPPNECRVLVWRGGVLGRGPPSAHTLCVPCTGIILEYEQADELRNKSIDLLNLSGE